MVLNHDGGRAEIRRSNEAPRHVAGCVWECVHALVGRSAMLPLLCSSLGLSAGSLMECTDGGPWACSEAGCPAPELSCERLALDNLCSYAFSAFFDTPPEGMSSVVVRDSCPRACGRCGLLSPDRCNMERVDARVLRGRALADALVNAATPVVVEGAMEAWRDGSSCWRYPKLFSAHGALPIKVIVDGGRYRGEPTEEVQMEMHDYPRAMRNGTLPDAAYVFTDVQDELACEDLFHLVPRSHATRARLILSMGSWGNGRPFHAHGPALFGLMHGVKRWFVRRPNATFAWQTYEVARDDLRTSEELPDGWADQLWQCPQREGELLWVPDLMQHSTLNYSPETVGFAMVVDELHPPTPLHLAAQAGAAKEVRALLKRGSQIDATAAGGATALHHAAGLGHCEAAEALLDAGASVHAKASGGGNVTPLHVAAAGGHAKAVELLLKRGAPPLAIDQNGYTALDLAEQLGHAAVARVLRASAEPAGA